MFVVLANVSQKAGDPLFPGYTSEVREKSRQYLFGKSESTFCSLTPIEEPLVAGFGFPMSLMIIDTLKRWAVTMLRKLRDSPELSPIREREHVNLIMDFTGEFETEYESRFGKMEDTNIGRPGIIKRNAVYIRSTAYGTKVFLGLLMADRLQVIDRKRREAREKIGFMKMIASEIADDSKDCPICQDAMGVINSEGKLETPIKLTVCCGQVFGDQWYGAIPVFHISKMYPIETDTNLHLVFAYG